MGSETWYEICMLCPAAYRYGLSGTPMDRTDGANLRLIAAIGDVIVDIPNKFLMERGISAKTSIIWTKITSPVLPKKLTYPTAYKQGIVDNPNALEAVILWTKIFAELKLGTLILCEEIAHGKAIDDALWTATDGQFIPHQFIHGSEDPETRKNTLADFAEGRLPVLIASTILDEGVDVPTIDALILAGSRKSKIKTMQRLGRGLRGKKLIAVEFANYCHDHLLRHSLVRYEDYKKEECFPLYQSPPDIELVKRLWNESR
jgi:superfamily II DNA or RNA helicase